MAGNSKTRRFLRLVSFADWRNEALGPVQFQLFIAAIFLCPLALRLAYSLGVPRPSSLWVRIAISGIALVAIALLYRCCCRLLGIPMAKHG